MLEFPGIGGNVLVLRDFKRLGIFKLCKKKEKKKEKNTVIRILLESISLGVIICRMLYQKRKKTSIDQYE